MRNLFKIKTEYPVPEYQPFIKLRIVSLIMFGLLLIGLLGVTIFIYNNIYTAIGQVQSIIVLESKLGIEAINFDLFEKVKKAWEEKQTDSLPTINRDPFNPVQN